MKKNRGFRREHSLAKARYMRNNGASVASTMSFLCQKGWSRV
jgi:hypothetical protein